MREVKLHFVTEVTNPKTGDTWHLKRQDEQWCQAAEANGWIVINTEYELPTEEEN